MSAGEGNVPAAPAIVDRGALQAACDVVNAVRDDGGGTTVEHMLGRASVDVRGCGGVASVLGMQVLPQVGDSHSTIDVWNMAFGMGVAVGVLAARAADRGAS